LVRTVADQVKRHRAQGRDDRREQPLEVILDQSSAAFHERLAAPVSSPSSHAIRREQAVLLADALETLPADYREVFVMRILEQVPIEAIETRMGRSVNAVRKLSTRAMLAL
jgi:RNA polymerase sigma-70 factor (ECF subfamily)